MKVHRRIPGPRWLVWIGVVPLVLGGCGVGSTPDPTLVDPSDPGASDVPSASEVAGVPSPSPDSIDSVVRALGARLLRPADLDRDWVLGVQEATSDDEGWDGEPTHVPDVGNALQGYWCEEVENLDEVSRSLPDWQVFTRLELADSGASDEAGEHVVIHEAVAAGDPSQIHRAFRSARDYLERWCYDREDVDVAFDRLAVPPFGDERFGVLRTGPAYEGDDGDGRQEITYATFVYTGRALVRLEVFVDVPYLEPPSTPSQPPLSQEQINTITTTAIAKLA
jgi:hypothetical protein